MQQLQCNYGMKLLLHVKIKYKLTASLFVGVVAAVVFVIAFLRQFNASLTVGAPELVQLTRDSGTVLLVLTGAAV